MEDYYTKKLELIHRLAEFSSEGIDDLAQQAKSLHEAPLNKVSIEELQSLADRISYLQDETMLKIPCKAEGDLYINAHFYPSEGKFEPSDSPSLRITKLELGKAVRVPKPMNLPEQWDKNADHIFLRKDLEPELTTFKDLRELEQDLLKIAATHGIDLFELTDKLAKIKECRMIDAHQAGRIDGLPED